MPELTERSPEFTGRKPDEPEYLVDRMNSEAVDFIKRNKDKPFFLVSVALRGSHDFGRQTVAG